MDTAKRSLPLWVSIFFRSILIAGLCTWLEACARGGTPSESAAPTLPPLISTNTPFVPAEAAQAPSPACNDNLIFLYDVTIPDYTVVAPGSSLDKQWMVQNSGSCNWDVRYRLRLVSGELLGAPAEQALYPARSGTQAALRILFTAPNEAGSYYSEWQAFGPDGNPFGESFAIRIVVSQ